MTKEDLKRRICTVCVNVTPEMLFRVRQNFVKRINKRLINMYRNMLKLFRK